VILLRNPRSFPLAAGRAPFNNCNSLLIMQISCLGTAATGVTFGYVKALCGPDQTG
jgi:hypothetical protein